MKKIIRNKSKNGIAIGVENENKPHLGKGMGKGKGVGFTFGSTLSVRLLLISIIIIIISFITHPNLILSLSILKFSTLHTHGNYYHHFYTSEPRDLLSTLLSYL